MTLGIIARCDGGGLAALTREVHRHLNADRILLVDLEDRGRGECVPDEYLGANVYRTTFAGALADRAIEWLCAEGIDTLWTAEFWYGDNVLSAAHASGIRTVLYAMPELTEWCIDPGKRPRPHVFTAPTAWRFDSLPPNTQLLPMPVARDRLLYRVRDRAVELFHVTGAAMLDRNGTELLLAALQFVTADVHVTIRTERPITVPSCQVQVDVITDPVVDYWASVPDNTDLLVMPRRYGGLSLPVQECAARGIPAVMLQTDPYAPYGFVHAIPATRSREHRMKGGMVPVHDADPRVLAQMIDFLADHPEHAVPASNAADAWAAQHAWDGPLGERWCSLLTARCAEPAA